MKWLWLTLAVVALFIGRSLWRIIRYLPRARSDMSSLRAEDLARLASECERAFAAKFQVELASKSAEEAVVALDQHLRRRNIWEFFRDRKQPGWRYATVIGSYLGELVRRETGAAWSFPAGQPPVLELQRGEASFMAAPFERVLMHHVKGMDGDLSAWFSTLRVVGRRIQSEGISSETSA